MKKNTSWKFTNGSSVTFQSSVSGPGEFGQSTNLLLRRPQRDCSPFETDLVIPWCYRERTRVINLGNNWSSTGCFLTQMHPKTQLVFSMNGSYFFKASHEENTKSFSIFSRKNNNNNLCIFFVKLEITIVYHFIIIEIVTQRARKFKKVQAKKTREIK